MGKFMSAAKIVAGKILWTRSLLWNAKILYPKDGTLHQNGRKPLSKEQNENSPIVLRS